MNTLFPTNSFDLPMSYAVATVIARDAASAAATPAIDGAGIAIVRLADECGLGDAHERATAPRRAGRLRRLFAAH